jgi:hypothetical protein
MKYMLDEANPTAEAWVDDKQLHRGDSEGVDLTKDQVERLEQAGASLSKAKTTNNEGG